MKTYIAILLVIVVLLSAAVYTQYALSQASDQLSSSLNGVHDSINKQSWNSAAEGIKVTEEVWEKHKYWWSMVIDHQEIDQIELSLAKSNEYIKTKNLTLAYSELAVLKVLFEHIPEKEAVNLKNIF